MADGQEAPYIEGGGEHNQTPWCCSACLVSHSYGDICQNSCLLASSSGAQTMMCINEVSCTLHESVVAVQEKACMELTQQMTQPSHLSARMLTS